MAFQEPWQDLRGTGTEEERQRSAIARELLAEVAAGHSLASVSGEVIARSGASDDVLLLLEDGRWALVHMTWRRTPEPPPYPHVKFFDSLPALERALTD